MFRVGLLMIISKYIGETEKNLGWIFEDATTVNVILGVCGITSCIVNYPIHILHLKRFYNSQNKV